MVLKKKNLQYNNIDFALILIRVEIHAQALARVNKEVQVPAAMILSLVT